LSQDVSRFYACISAIGYQEQALFLIHSKTLVKSQSRWLSCSVRRFNQLGLVPRMAHILAIDDDSAICATVCLILERAGHHVVTAQDGRGGLKLLEADRFDLLLIDIFMPEMDGLETIRMVRRSRPELPIIVMSGSVERAKMPDYLSFATKLGAIESLRKPFKPAILVDTVDRCLARRSGD